MHNTLELTFDRESKPTTHMLVTIRSAYVFSHTDRVLKLDLSRAVHSLFIIICNIFTPDSNHPFLLVPFDVDTARYPTVRSILQAIILFSCNKSRKIDVALGCM